MNSKRLSLGIGVALAVLVVLTAPASAVSPVYFEPDPSSAVTGDDLWVNVFVELEPGETLQSGQLQIINDVDDGSGGEGLDHAFIRKCGKGCKQSEGWCWESLTCNTTYIENGHIWIVFYGPQYWDEDDEEWKSIPCGYFGPYTTSEKIRLGRIKVEANSTLTPGISPLEFSFEYLPEPDCPICQQSWLFGHYDENPPMEWYNGTFIHIGLPETFSKELAAGWNLISLPLTPPLGDNSTSEVLSSISYDAVYSYNATAKEFEDVATGTMDPGIGYFVNVTTATGTWTYEGTAYTSMSSVDLKHGLNLVGWLNTSADLPGALDSIAGEYNYVARWNATSPNYEVYDANAPPGVPEFIDFYEMERGNGYWIAAKED